MVRDVGGQGKPGAFQVKHEVNVDRSHFEPILDAMQSVIEDRTGTGRMAQTEGIVMCGKTGTVQNPNDADHSVFIALAPQDEPQIALSVYVENAGSGGSGPPLSQGCWSRNISMDPSKGSTEKPVHSWSHISVR